VASLICADRAGGSCGKTRSGTPKGWNPPQDEAVSAALEALLELKPDFSYRWGRPLRVAGGESVGRARTPVVPPSYVFFGNCYPAVPEIRSPGR